MAMQFKDLIKWADDNRAAVMETYRYLHETAEISWGEIKTTEYLCRRLNEIDISFQTFADHTGVVASWSGGDGPVIALRADMDALWQYVDGTWKANHSCGHDAHMTMVLEALRCLKEVGYRPPGKLKVIFQPAEETGKALKS